jgi:hypothetical protein
VFKLLTYQNFIITNLSAALEVSQFILLWIVVVILRLSHVGFLMDIVELRQVFSPEYYFLSLSTPFHQFYLHLLCSVCVLIFIVL